MKYLWVLLVAMFTVQAHASCSGSGLIWSCTSGSTVSQVNTAMSSATDGATITFAAGSYTWSSSMLFSTSKGMTLICASVGACSATLSGTVFGMSTWSGTVTKLYRISGFAFTVGDFPIWFGTGGSVNGTLTQIRIDHNTFAVATNGHVIVIGENASMAQAYGVIDHNTFTGSGSIEAVYMLGIVNPTPITGRLGSGNNMFFEDNTVTVTTMTDGGLGAVDGWGAAFSMVFRHNTVTNSLVTSHGATHGGGPPNWELYNNSLIANSHSTYTDGYRLFHHQGSGTFIAFNNSFTASSGKNVDALSMTNYRSFPSSIDGGTPQCDGTVTTPFDDGLTDGNRSTTATNRGYPCWHQPGRDFAGTIVPMYDWNNKWSDNSANVPMAMEDLGGSPDYISNHEQANRDYFNAVSASAQSSATSPFNGTSGMGFGTIANRPTTCTSNTTENAFGAGTSGVGYFATDVGTQGTLYQCTATNTWTAYYTPYAYPHPLTVTNNTFYIRSDGGTRKDANVPAGQCDGLSDVAQSGSTGNHCAFSDFRYMWDDGTFTCANNCWAMSGGDTVIIRGCASGSTSTAPDCRIGSDTQTASGSIWCPGVGNAGCYNPPIPAGTAGQHTRILGQNYAACSTGTPGTINYTVDKTKLTQLFGGWGVGLVLNLTSTQYVDVECIQLWRHSQCIFFGSPASPAACNRSFPSEDDYVDSAIALNASTSNLLLQDMWIHGMLSRGTLGPIGGPVDMERVDVDTNGGAGLDFDDGSATPFGAGASLTLNNSIIEWNGCNQEYPFVDAIPVASCYSQSTGGYGDGIGTPNANTGLNVSMNQSIFRYNTQDGFDFGHVENTGYTFVLTNSISYGNGGGALKWSDGFTSQKAVNNLAIANCFRMSQPITGTPSGYNTNLGDFCRAGDAISINTKTGDSTLFANNTIVTYAPTTFDLGCNDPTSCATSTFNMFNNIVIGYDNPATYSGGGQAGGPGGFCLPGCNSTTHPITLLTTQFNDYYLVRTITCPTGHTGEICTSPSLTSQPAGQGVGFVESQLDVYTAALTLNLVPTAGSPVTHAGTSYTGSLANDFAGNVFSSPLPMGAFNPSATAPASRLDGASFFSGKVTTP